MRHPARRGTRPATAVRGMPAVQAPPPQHDGLDTLQPRKVVSGVVAIKRATEAAWTPAVPPRASGCFEQIGETVGGGAAIPTRWSELQRFAVMALGPLGPALVRIDVAEVQVAEHRLDG